MTEHDLWPLEATLKCWVCWRDAVLEADGFIRCECGYTDDPDAREPMDEEAKAELKEKHYG